MRLVGVLPLCPHNKETSTPEGGLRQEATKEAEARHCKSYSSLMTHYRIPAGSSPLRCGKLIDLSNAEIRTGIGLRIIL